jgi:hypothetical protein
MPPNMTKTMIRIGMRVLIAERVLIQRSVGFVHPPSILTIALLFDKAMTISSQYLAEFAFASHVLESQLAIGREKVNVLPLSSSLETVIVPFCNSTSRREMAKPMPVPPE